MESQKAIRVPKELREFADIFCRMFWKSKRKQKERNRAN